MTIASKLAPYAASLVAAPWVDGRHAAAPACCQLLAQFVTQVSGDALQCGS